MNPRLKIAAVLGSVVLAVIGVATGKTFFSKSGPVPHALVLSDWSGSASADCGSVVALARQQMQLLKDQSGSTITVSVTGDEATANEPRYVGTFAIPVSERAVEGTKIVGRRQEELLSQIGNRCRQMPIARKSSIFLGLKDGVEQLKSKGCGQQSGCLLFAKSDLQENAEPLIAAALKGGERRPSKLPNPIDNRGIKISICGIAETKGLVKDDAGASKQLTRNRDAQQFELIRKVWSSLFAAPELVTYSAFCSE